MISEPKLEERSARPYVARRTKATMNELSTVIPQQLGEVFAWLGRQGIAPAGPAPDPLSCDRHDGPARY